MLNRRSLRLKGYDYSQAGLYYITICIKDRQCLFGRVENQQMILNDAGHMVKQWYHEIENKHPDKKCHEMVIMPNHIHFIIATIPTVVQWFKTMTTNEYIRGVKNHQWKPFNGKLWQRNYWEHIIRNDLSYANISTYILENPQQWNSDSFNK